MNELHNPEQNCHHSGGTLPLFTPRPEALIHPHTYQSLTNCSSIKWRPVCQVYTKLRLQQFLRHEHLQESRGRIPPG